MPAEILELATHARTRSDPLPDESSSLTAVGEGHIDLYGYHEFANGLFLCGWLSYPWPGGKRPQRIVAHFESAEPVESSLVAFHYREDVRGRGIGLVSFVECDSGPPTPFIGLELCFANLSYTIQPTKEARTLTAGELVQQLQHFLSGGEENSSRRRLQALLLQDKNRTDPAPRATISGHVDFYGYHVAAGGCFFCGWLTSGWRDGACAERLLASFENDDISGEAVALCYQRSDLSDGREGVVIFVRSPAGPRGGLWLLSFEVGGVRAILQPGPKSPRLPELDLIGMLRPILAGAPPEPQRDALLALLALRTYTGTDTLADLSDRVFLEIDEAIVCEPDGLLLMGWSLARNGVIRSVNLHCGQLITPLQLDQWIALERPDVLAAVGADYACDDPRVGFIVFLPHSISPKNRIYLKVETVRREVGFRSVPIPKLSGIAAIRRLLDACDLRFTAVERAYDRVLGPAIEMLNRSRLSERPSVTVVDYGVVPPNPRYSVIVSVYGRLDFVECQLALFSAYAPNAGGSFSTFSTIH